MSTSPQTSSAPLKVGILLYTARTQLLDLAAIDLLGMLTPECLRIISQPENIIAYAHPFQFQYIVDVVKGDGDGPVPTDVPVTAGGNVRVTDTLDSVDKLDILFIPGPSPNYVPSSPTTTFLRTQTACSRAVLIICTGIIPAASSGFLTDKRATAPLSMLPTLREEYPDVQWVAKRWTVDGDGGGDGNGGRKIWTSGTVVNGIDMMAAFIKEFAPEIGSMVCKSADVGERADEYPYEQLKLQSF